MVLTRGNPRFKGGGTLWKTSWGRRVPFSQVCCVEGFQPGPGGQYYENTTADPLDIVPASGFVFGALVVVEAPPSGVAPIALNGDGSTEGWLLTMFDDTVGAGEPAVGFDFTVFDGAAPAATATASALLLRSIAEAGGAIAFALMAGFEPPSGGFPDGRIGLSYGGPTAVTTPLSAPYANASPGFILGLNGADAFTLPNCIAGVVGGTAPFAQGALDGQLQQTWAAWFADVDEAGQVVEIPDPASIPVTNTNGWRIGPNSAPFLSSPNPLPGFVGADGLVYGDPQGTNLTVECHSPLVIYPQNLAFPFA